MTGVTQDRDQDSAGLSAVDEQLLREATQAGPRRRGEADRRGGLLGRLTKMVIEGDLEGEMDDR